MAKRNHKKSMNRQKARNHVKTVGTVSPVLITAGKWYCKNPNISVFNPPRDIGFEKKGSVKD